MGRSIKGRFCRVAAAPSAVGVLAVLAAAGVAGAQPVTSFSGITSWVGAGPNSAALVIDWNNGVGGNDTSLVWGYHWTGSATAEQMLDAIVAVDPHLYDYILQTSDYGDAPAGIGYEPAAAGNFPLTPALTFTDRMATTADTGQIDDSRTAVDPGDLWEEGWDAGYWAYWVSTNSDLAANVAYLDGHVDQVQQQTGYVVATVGGFAAGHLTSGDISATSPYGSVP